MSMFANRLKKNANHLRKWARRVGTEAYRVYDKDIPEYAFSVDLYGPNAVVYEYEGPEDVPSKADEVLEAVHLFLEIPESRIFHKVRRRIVLREEQYTRSEERSFETVVMEQGQRFKVVLGAYLDSGLFLDHRKSRAFVRANAAGKRFLNLYCYTGAATVYAAAGGATETVSVDLSNTYLEWARENMRMNGFDPENGIHSFLREDAMRALSDLKFQGRKFDLLFVDPPSFSNSKKMVGHFDVQEHHADLLLACSKVLSEDGIIFFSNNNRKFKLDENALSGIFSYESMTEKTLPDDFRSRRIHNSWLLRKKTSIA
ncbi:MAG: class I SAM-dependent methyltransferase [Silvanigrellales bacterium]|nr:class I SAM-dependent methyltransferase [Silvanigrellales bacterium]